ncbi:Hsp70 family protein [Treponema sp.]|uniref:Hsp70 family protein n=1 Tax=Treponema sp. TaxID=166 RepID=UPI00298E4C49|nr:Hsp70 family protein [Treponema sp.]MCQ2240954.1 LysM peptidoglycan-binding domain-containing protein [Treponema sp.]
MKSIGIKLADGSFYPLLEEGNPEKRTLDLTTVMDNQTKVQVEVYRTDTGSLEGAEYIDTLEIKNLKPHENGEPTLCLAIDVDENNELSAEIRDPETGKKSEIQVTLQSRTLAGLNGGAIEEEEDDVTISDNDLEKAGLDDFVEKKEFESEEIPLPSEDFSFEDVNEPAHAEEEISETEEPTLSENSSTNDAEDIFGENSLELPEFGAKEEAAEETEEPTKEDEPEVEDPVVDEPFEETSVEEPTLSDDDIFDDDFSAEETIAEDSSVTEETENTEEDFANDLPDFDDSMFEMPAEEKEEEPASDNSADDLGGDLELPDFDDLDATTLDDSTVESSDSSTEILDLPDFDDLEATSLGTDDYTTSTEDDSSLYDLPDFDSDESLTDDTEDFTLPPDFDVKNEGDDILNFDEQPKNPTFAPSTSMFSNLYDKETLEGTSGTYDFEEEKEKPGNSKVPMIICIICAIICILAVLLTLFVIPSNFNIFSKFTKNNDVKVEVIEEEPEELTEAAEEEPPVYTETNEVISAKEDTIVVAETPAAVVPAEPEPSPEPIPDIRYKIVWGDTLWDISTAYYKTPWKYKKLAKYNKIRNPDHIIAGTYILIPAE